MNLQKAIEIKQKYQYMLLDASFPELIEADILSIQALKRVELHRTDRRYPFNTLLPSETKD